MIVIGQQVDDKLFLVAHEEPFLVLSPKLLLQLVFKARVTMVVILVDTALREFKQDSPVELISVGVDTIHHLIGCLEVALHFFALDFAVFD